MSRYYSKWWLIGLFCLMALCSCATQYQIVNVIDARALPNLPNNKSYWLIPGDSTISASSLAYIGYARDIDHLLQQRGYTKAQTAAQANVVIFLSYKVLGPRTKFYTQSDPIWFPNQAFNNNDCINCLPLPIYQENIYSQDVYQMQLQLEAYQAQPYFKEKQLKALWSVHDSVFTSSSDLRAIFPYMAVAAAQYIGQDSGQQVRLGISQNNPTVLQLKGHVNPQSE